MNSYVQPFISAAILAIGLSVTSANAVILVSGTNAVGVLGQTVNPTYTIDTSVSPGIDVTQISGWDFELNWDAAALEFNPAASSIKVNNVFDGTLPGFLAYLEALDTDFDPLEDVSENLNQALGFYRFSWVDMSLDPLKQLGIGSSTSSILFTAAFEIESGAVIGTPYDITFGAAPNQSRLVDIDLNQASYLSASPAMQVTRRSDTPPTPAPEPGMLGLLLGGMAAYLGAVRLRRSGRGLRGVYAGFTFPAVPRHRLTYAS